MLIKEIGRFGDSVENLKPTDLTDEIPSNLKKSDVGFFWHIGNNLWIIRKANVLDNSICAVEMGQNYDEETNPDDLQIDYGLFHKEVWSDEIRVKPEYSTFDFDHFSRGRVIYEAANKKYIIFVPNGFEFKKDIISFLAKSFNLPSDGYTVNSKIYRRKKDFETLEQNENYILNV